MGNVAASLGPFNISEIILSEHQGGQQGAWEVSRIVERCELEALWGKTWVVGKCGVCIPPTTTMCLQGHGNPGDHLITSKGMMGLPAVTAMGILQKLAVADAANLRGKKKNYAG
eukprot:scaffold250271_cov18-Tisochrysis_lutea.AAC.1